MQNIGIFYGQIEHFMAIWYILYPFGIYIVVIWSIFAILQTKISIWVYFGTRNAECWYIL
jgi:Gpi18-like mannosyltransferase